MNKKNQEKSSHSLGIGIALTTAAVAAVGTYFLYGSSEASKNRKKVKSWMLRAKAEVLDGLDNIKYMTEEDFQKLVSTAVATYAHAQKMSKAEIRDFTKEMHDSWEFLVNSGTVKLLTTEQMAKSLANKETKSKAKTAPKKKATGKKTAKKTSSKKSTGKKVSTKKIKK